MKNYKRFGNALNVAKKNTLKDGIARVIVKLDEDKTYVIFPASTPTHKICQTVNDIVYNKALVWKGYHDRKDGSVSCMKNENVRCSEYIAAFCDGAMFSNP